MAVIDQLPDLFTFDRIVAGGSLSAAAQELDLSLAVVSKRLARLERSLGVRLVQRTTRRQRLTEEGLLFHRQVQRILDEVQRAEQLMSERAQAVDGLLQLSAPGALGRRWVAPIVADFQRLHPAVHVRMDVTDTVVDLLESGLDLAIRFGRLADSSMIARPLAPNYRVLCASPGYVREYGMPTRPQDLAEHRCILIGDSAHAEWLFEGASVRVRAHLFSNDGSTVHAWTRAGAGIALRSIWDVGDDIRNGLLCRVLPRCSMPAAPLQAVYPNGRHLAPRVRAFIDYLSQRLRQSWRWDALREDWPAAVPEPEIR